MKKQRLALLLCTIAGLALNSCSPLYLPNAVNTPMLTNQGEFQAAIHISPASAGVEPQFAYAVSDNIGVLLNASFPVLEEIEHKHPSVEMAAGYYTSIGNKGIFEIYGGGGYRSLSGMKAKDYFDKNNNDSSELFYYTNFFVQPTIGKTGKIFDLGVTPRFTLVNIVDESERHTKAFFEPVVTIKLGYEFIKFTMQSGFSLPFMAFERTYINALYMSWGLQISLNKIYE